VSLPLVRWLLKLERRALERHLTGAYDPLVSKQLDAVIVAIEALQ
jgi:hypothetical protein